MVIFSSFMPFVALHPEFCLFRVIFYRQRPRYVFRNSHTGGAILALKSSSCLYTERYCAT